jgi:MFS family permease
MNKEYIALSSTSLAHLSNDGIFLLFSSLIVYYSHPSMGLNVTILGIFASIYTLVSGILSLPIGKWSDSGDRDPELMSLGILILGFSLILFAIPFYYVTTMTLSVKYLIVGMGAIVLGFGQAFYHPLGADILRYSLRGKDSSFLLGINGSFGSIGRAVILFIAGIMIIDFGAFRGLFFLSLYYFVIALVIYEMSRKIRKSDKIVEKAVERNKKLKREQVVKISSFPGVVGFLSILTLTLFLRSFFQLAVATYAFKYIDTIYNNNFLSYLFLSVALVTPIIGQPIFGQLTKRKGGNFTLLFAGSLSLAAFIPFLYFSNYYIVSLVFFSIYAFAAFTGFPSILGFLNQKIPPAISTRANTWAWGIGNTVGGAFGIIVFTVLSQILRVSEETSFVIMLFFLALSVITNLMIRPFSNKLKSQITS